jgi:ATP-dependent exoDNAse (exonuclease V) beta subunit
MSEVPFTIDQEKACDVSKRNLDACVVAGPGSGKTTVLVEYFRRLVAENVDPLRILAITFTEKAAGNMRKKLAAAFQDNSEIRARLERAWVSTVHGFCARLLRENAVFAGVDPEFQVADERDSWRMQRDALARAIDVVLDSHPAAMRALIRGLSSAYFEDAVLAAYDAMRGAGRGIDELAAAPVPGGVTVEDIAKTLNQVRRDPLTAWSYAQKQQFDCAVEGAQRIVSAASPLEALHAIEAFSCNLTKCKHGSAARGLLKQMKQEIEDARYTLITAFYAQQRTMLLHILSRFDQLYRERKRQAAMLDFADLEEFTVRLLEDHPETRARLQAQFDHILMDEFQDTNGQQAKLIRLVRPPNRFYAVGDINQSIFGFRHAEPQGFSDYRDQIERTGGRAVKLVDNFRSRAGILRGVETITQGAGGIEPRSLVAGRKFKTERDVSVEVIAAPEMQMEAQWVARRVRELCSESFDFKDVAVLVRNTEVISEFTDAFDAAGIPYLVNRGKGFYEAREVNDLTHLLRVIANPRDEISLAVVLRSPLVEASDEALLRLKNMGDNMGQSLWHIEPAPTQFTADDHLKLSRFANRLREWRICREYASFDRLLLAAIDDCGYRAESGERGAANIDKFLAQARDAASGMSLDEFVEELSLVRDSNPREPDAPPEDSANAVKIMTVHSAKGLEFPVVFVAALHKGMKSDLPVVAFSRTYGLGARWRNPAKREDKDDLFMHALREEWKKREAEESDRLLYVAMTRAEEHLALSFSIGDRKPANWAAVVVAKLGLNTEHACDEVRTCTAPDGSPWKLKLLVTDRAPEPAAHAGTGFMHAEPAVLVQQARPPLVTGQQDTNATVTALAEFAACPRQYYLGRYLGFEGRRRKLAVSDEDGDAEADVDLSAGEFGTQVHALLAEIPVPDAHPEAVRLAEVFRNGPLGRRAARAPRVSREFDFLMAVEDLVIRGQVDLWFEEGGELTVVDYKTDDVTAVQARQRARDYGLQLRLYAMAVERVAGRPPDRAWLHFLRPDTLIEVDLTPSLLESPEQMVRDFQEAQSRLEFPLNEGERCQRCPFYRDLCPAGAA